MIAPSKLPARLSNHEPTSSCRNTSQSTVTKLLMESLRLLACFRPDTTQPSWVNPLSAPKYSFRSEDKREGKLMSTTDDVCCALLLSAPLLQPTSGVCSVVSPQSRARSTSILLLRNPTAHLPSSLSSTSTFPRRHDGESLCRLQKSASERLPRQRDLHKCHYCRCCYELRNLCFLRYWLFVIIDRSGKDTAITVFGIRYGDFEFHYRVTFFSPVMENTHLASHPWSSARLKSKSIHKIPHIPSPSNRSFDNYACLSCQILPVVMARTAESRGAAEMVGWEEHPVRCL